MLDEVLGSDRFGNANQLNYASSFAVLLGKS